MSNSSPPDLAGLPRRPTYRISAGSATSDVPHGGGLAGLNVPPRSYVDHPPGNVPGQGDTNARTRALQTEGEEGGGTASELEGMSRRLYEGGVGGLPPRFEPMLMNIGKRLWAAVVDPALSRQIGGLMGRVLSLETYPLIRPPDEIENDIREVLRHRDDDYDGLRAVVPGDAKEKAKDNVPDSRYYYYDYRSRLGGGFLGRYKKDQFSPDVKSPGRHAQHKAPQDRRKWTWPFARLLKHFKKRKPSALAAYISSQNAAEPPHPHKHQSIIQFGRDAFAAADVADATGAGLAIGGDVNTESSASFQPIQSSVRRRVVYYVSRFFFSSRTERALRFTCLVPIVLWVSYDKRLVKSNFRHLTVIIYTIMSALMQPVMASISLLWFLASPSLLLALALLTLCWYWDTRVPESGWSELTVNCLQVLSMGILFLFAAAFKTGNLAPLMSIAFFTVIYASEYSLIQSYNTVRHGLTLTVEQAPLSQIAENIDAIVGKIGGPLGLALRLVLPQVKVLLGVAQVVPVDRLIIIPEKILTVAGGTEDLIGTPIRVQAASQTGLTISMPGGMRILKVFWKGKGDAGFFWGAMIFSLVATAFFTLALLIPPQRSMRDQLLRSLVNVVEKSVHVSWNSATKFSILEPIDSKRNQSLDSSGSNTTVSSDSSTESGKEPVVPPKQEPMQPSSGTPSFEFDLSSSDGGSTRADFYRIFGPSPIDAEESKLFAATESTLGRMITSWSLSVVEGLLVSPIGINTSFSGLQAVAALMGLNFCHYLACRQARLIHSCWGKQLRGNNFRSPPSIVSPEFKACMEAFTLPCEEFYEPPPAPSSGEKHISPYPREHLKPTATAWRRIVSDAWLANFRKTHPLVSVEYRRRRPKFITVKTLPPGEVIDEDLDAHCIPPGFGRLWQDEVQKLVKRIHRVKHAQLPIIDRVALKEHLAVAKEGLTRDFFWPPQLPEEVEDSEHFRLHWWKGCVIDSLNVLTAVKMATAVHPPVRGNHGGMVLHDHLEEELSRVLEVLKWRQDQFFDYLAAYTPLSKVAVMRRQLTLQEVVNTFPKEFPIPPIEIYPDVLNRHKLLPLVLRARRRRARAEKRDRAKRESRSDTQSGRPRDSFDKSPAMTVKEFRVAVPESVNGSRGSWDGSRRSATESGASAEGSAGSWDESHVSVIDSGASMEGSGGSWDGPSGHVVKRRWSVGGPPRAEFAPREVIERDQGKHTRSDDGGVRRRASKRPREPPHSAHLSLLLETKLKARIKKKLRPKPIERPKDTPVFFPVANPPSMALLPYSELPLEEGKETMPGGDPYMFVPPKFIRPPVEMVRTYLHAHAAAELDYRRFFSLRGALPRGRGLTMYAAQEGAGGTPRKHVTRESSATKGLRDKSAETRNVEVKSLAGRSSSTGASKKGTPRSVVQRPIYDTPLTFDEVFCEQGAIKFPEVEKLVTIIEPPFLKLTDPGLWPSSRYPTGIMFRVGGETPHVGEVLIRDGRYVPIPPIVPTSFREDKLVGEPVYRNSRGFDELLLVGDIKRYLTLSKWMDSFSNQRFGNSLENRPKITSLGKVKESDKLRVLREGFSRPAVTRSPSSMPLPAQDPSSIPLPAQDLSGIPLPAQDPSSIPLPAQDPSSIPLPARKPPRIPLPAQKPSSTSALTQRTSSIPLPTQKLSSLPHPAQKPSSIPVSTQKPSSIPVSRQKPSSIPLSMIFTEVMPDPDGVPNEFEGWSSQAWDTAFALWLFYFYQCHIFYPLELGRVSLSTMRKTHRKLRNMLLNLFTFGLPFGLLFYAALLPYVKLCRTLLTRVRGGPWEETIAKPTFDIDLDLKFPPTAPEAASKYARLRKAQSGSRAEKRPMASDRHTERQAQILAANIRLQEWERALDEQKGREKEDSGAKLTHRGGAEPENIRVETDSSPPLTSPPPAKPEVAKQPAQTRGRDERAGQESATGEADKQQKTPKWRELTPSSPLGRRKFKKGDKNSKRTALFTSSRIPSTYHIRFVTVKPKPESLRSQPDLAEPFPDFSPPSRPPNVEAAALATRSNANDEEGQDVDANSTWRVGNSQELEGEAQSGSPLGSRSNSQASEVWTDGDKNLTPESVAQLARNALLRTQVHPRGSGERSHNSRRGSVENMGSSSAFMTPGLSFPSIPGEPLPRIEEISRRLSSMTRPPVAPSESVLQKKRKGELKGLLQKEKDAIRDEELRATRRIGAPAKQVMMPGMAFGGGPSRVVFRKMDSTLRSQSFWTRAKKKLEPPDRVCEIEFYTLSERLPPEIVTQTPPQKFGIFEMNTFWTVARITLGATALLAVALFSERWRTLTLLSRPKPSQFGGIPNLRARWEDLQSAKYAPWSCLGFLITLSGTYEGTIKKATLRSIGVVLGTLSAYVLLLITPTNGYVHGVWITFFDFIVIFLAANPSIPEANFHPSWGYAAQVFTYQQVIIAVEIYLGQADRDELVLARLVGQLVGIVTALLVSVLIFPTWANRAARYNLTRALKDLNESFVSLAELCLLDEVPPFLTQERFKDAVERWAFYENTQLVAAETHVKRARDMMGELEVTAEYDRVVPNIHLVQIADAVSRLARGRAANGHLLKKLIDYDLLHRRVIDPVYLIESGRFLHTFREIMELINALYVLLEDTLIPSANPYLPDRRYPPTTYEAFPLYVEALVRAVEERLLCLQTIDFVGSNLKTGCDEACTVWGAKLTRLDVIWNCVLLELQELNHMAALIQRVQREKLYLLVNQWF